MTGPSAEAISERLAKLGIYNQDGISESARASMLVLGHPKTGKTTCLAKSAPKPLIINCDGPSATKGAMKEGAKFLAIDAYTRASWKKAQDVTTELVKSGEVESIIVDSLSLLYDNLLDEIGISLDGFDKWNELHSVGMGGIKRLAKLDAHLFLVAHFEPGEDGTAGILPIIPGQDKKKIGALVNDWVILDCDPNRKPHPRMWALGQQANWGRNIRRSCMVEATVPALFAEMGIPL
jgi:hypothetical protein